jgi:hypothetical protein
MDNSNPELILKKIYQLYRLRDKLSTMDLAPKNIWIQQYTIVRGYEYYTYAKWEAAEPIFECAPSKLRKYMEYKDPTLALKRLVKYTRHKHIGRVSSSTGLPMVPEVRWAYRQLRNRRWLDRVEATLAKIELAISNF